MTEEKKVIEPTAKVDTIESLQVELKTAISAKEVNWKLVSGISEKLDKLTKSLASSERDAKLKALEAVTLKVKGAIEKALASFEKELELADGVWYSHDYGDQLSSCKLMKSAAKKVGSGGGGGTGKSFSISTDELLKKHGGEMMGDSGQTFSQAYDTDTDGNKRYLVRKRMLKAEGLV